MQGATLVMDERDDFPEPQVAAADITVALIAEMLLKILAIDFAECRAIDVTGAEDGPGSHERYGSACVRSWGRLGSGETVEIAKILVGPEHDQILPRKEAGFVHEQASDKPCRCPRLFRPAHVESRFRF